MHSSIIVVSGLPRSGTSLMMQMLDSGGVPVVTDNIRTADTDNPRGYYEYEIVKKIKADTSWVPATRGKAFKMVSQLLYDLPPNEDYEIVFMDRDMEEMLHSQEKMLKRLGRPVSRREQIMRAYQAHLEKLHDWLKRQRNMKLLRVSYNDLVKEPMEHASRVGEFLGGKASVEGMVKAVDTSLYRNRKLPAGGQPTADELTGVAPSTSVVPQQEMPCANGPLLDYVI